MFLLRIAHDDEAPGLQIVCARGTQSGVEDAAQVLGGNGPAIKAGGRASILDCPGKVFFRTHCSLQCSAWCRGALRAPGCPSKLSLMRFWQILLERKRDFPLACGRTVFYSVRRRSRSLLSPPSFSAPSPEVHVLEIMKIQPAELRRILGINSAEMKRGLTWLLQV